MPLNIETTPSAESVAVSRCFGAQQQIRYRGRNVVERCFNKLKQWRGIAMRTDKLARNYRAAIALAATLIWLSTSLINTT